MFESIGNWLDAHFLALWPAAIGAAVVVPAVVILYFLKLKRKEQVISSTLLWQRALEDMRVNAPFQRLRTNLLLLLQILILLAVAGALARPFIQGLSEGRKSGFILLVDNSASMSTRDVGGRTRLEAAREAALKEIDRVSGNVLAAVIAFGGRPRILCGFTSSRSELREAVGRIAPTGGDTDLSAALEVADGMAGSLGRDVRGSWGRSRCRLVVFSDAAIPENRPVKRVGPPEMDLEKYIDLRKFGGTSDNAGITSLEARRSPGSRSQVFVRVASFSASPARRSVRLFLGEATEAAEVKEVDLAPGARETVIFEVRAPMGVTPVRAELSAGDALGLDDLAFAVLPPERKLKVLAYIEKDEYFINRALKNLPSDRYEYYRGEPGKLPGAGAAPPSTWSGYDAVIFYRRGPGRLPPGGGFLFLGPEKAPPLPEAKLKKEVTAPGIVDWDRSHPLVRFASLAGVQVGRARPVHLGRGQVSLLESTDGPLIAAWQRDRLRLVAVGFDVYESNWPLRLSFPLFMANVARWLSEASPSWAGAGLRCGAPIELQPAFWPEQARKGSFAVSLLRPDGAKEKVEVSPERPRLYAATEQPGLYRARAGGREALFACAVLNEAESDNSAREGINFAVGGVHGATWSLADTGEKSGREVWKYLALAALAVMLLEWYIYNRRLWA